MAGSKMWSIDLLPKDPHCGLLCGATACGKSVFLLDLLETIYLHHFEFIVIFCPTIKRNKTYLDRKFIWTDDNIFVVDPRENLDRYLEYFYNLFEGTNTLFIIDDCSSQKDIVKKRKTLSFLAYSGRHANISVWIITQKYNAVLKDFREQLKFVVLFYCKDRDWFDACLQENDVINTKEERDCVKNQLKSVKHATLILKTDQPTNYKVVN